MTSLGISKKLSIQLNKIFIIILGWLFVGFLMSLYDHFLLASLFSIEDIKGYSFLQNLTFNLSAALMGSIFGSIWLVFYVHEKLRDKPYGYTLLMVAFSFIVIVIFVALVLGFTFVRYDDGYWPFTHPGATKSFYNYLNNPFHIKNIIVWANVVLLTQVGLMVNDKFGRGMLWTFVKGKYHHSQREQRVFMFVDLIGSTGIAERLGNDSYYKLLKDFFADITDSIIYNGGNIYQYVGDEVVISWQQPYGPNDALNCYFDMRQRINVLAETYREKYGEVPDFKAAVHCGMVTVGEIGIIKRELTFSGDVLNTTSRMLGFCKQYQQKLLVSEALYEFANQSPTKFEFQEMGEELLRGKTMKTRLFAVENRERE